MTEPGFGEIEYDSSINTPSKSESYYKAFHEPLIAEAKSGVSNGRVTVLNVACGPGHEFEFMENDPTLRLVGFDISPELIKRAQDKYRDKPASADFIIGDTKHPPISDNSADVGMAVNAVIYSPDAVLDALRGALKPGGKCAVNFRVYGNKFNEPFYKDQIEDGAELEDEDLNVNGQKFKLKVVNYAHHKTLHQLEKQVYFTSEKDIEIFIAAKGFIVNQHKKFHYSSPDNDDNEVEVYTLQKPIS